MSKSGEIFSKFVDVVRALRDPQSGCPWDLEQTHESLRPYLIEEAYEVLEAVDSANDKELCSELGDLLLQVLIHAQVAADRKAFTIDEVVQGISDKMISRHPHVFGDVKLKTSDQVLKNWEQLKNAERKDKAPDENHSLLSGVPEAMPALVRAQRLGHKAAKVSFDWDEVAQVWAKVGEEISELRDELDKSELLEGKDSRKRVKALSGERKQALEHELGDILFSLCQIARWLDVSAEDALRGTSKRFIERFQSMEKQATKPLVELSADELEKLWEAAKVSTSK